MEGIIEDAVPAMINNLITSANNPGKLSPPVYLSPQVVEYEGILERIGPDKGGWWKINR